MSIIFTHIPKTAGSTFLSILYKNIGKENILEFGMSKGKYSYKKYEQYLKSQFPPSKLYTGHVPFGTHIGVQEQSEYITFLREPTQRYISEYKDVTLIGNTYNHILRPSGLNKNMLYDLKGCTIEELIDFKYSESFSNLQTKYICNIDNPLRSINNKDFDTARDNLHNYFSFIGITEYFDLSLMILKEIFQWDNLSYTYTNESNKSPINLNDDTLLRINEINYYDKKLYDFALEKFEEQISQIGKEYLENSVQEFKEKQIPNKEVRAYDRNLGLISKIKHNIFKRIYPRD